MPLGLLGVLGAGAAQGYGEASNRNVDMQNQQAMMMQAEQLREQFAKRKFNRERKAQKEDLKLAGKQQEAQYKRERQDQMSDAELDFEREMKKLGVQESGKDRRAAMKAEREGILNKRQSTLGKTVQDLVDMGLADSKEDAYNAYTESGLARIIASSPGVLTTEDIIEHIRTWRSEMGLTKKDNGGGSGGDDGITFVRNPETGKLEMRK